MKKDKFKKGVAALMMVLILGTLVMVISVSQLSYNMWTRQSLEWSILKYQNSARASSASLYMAMNLFRDRSYSGNDVTVFYLADGDKAQGYSLSSNISTVTSPPADCATRTCKQISTSFTKNPFAITQTFYFIMMHPLMELGGGALLPNLRIPLLELLGGV